MKIPLYAALFELHPSFMNISKEVEVLRGDDVESIVGVEFFLDMAHLLLHVLDAFGGERAVESVTLVVVIAPSFKHAIVELEFADKVVRWPVEVCRCRCRLRPQSRSSRIH